MTKKDTFMTDEETKSLIINYIQDLMIDIEALYVKIYNNKVNVEDTNIIMKKLEEYLTELSTLMKFNPDYDKHLYISLENYRTNKILELEQQLKGNNEFMGYSEQCTLLEKKFHDFWRDEGFHYIPEFQISSVGSLSITCGFSCGFHSILAGSDKPITNKQKAEDSITKLRNNGFQFCRTGNNELLDTNKNKSLITKLLKKHFPSVIIMGWESMVSSKRINNKVIRELRIKQLKILIKDYNEILNLETHKTTS